MHGSITEVSEGQIRIKNDAEDSLNDVVLKINEETLIIHSDGLPAGSNELKTDMYVYAYIGPAMTMSLPPQVHAEAVIIGDKDIPLYMEVESVSGKGTGTLSITNKDKTNTIKVDKNTQVLPYKTKNIVTMEDIRVGSRLFAWTKNGDTAEKIVLAPYHYYSSMHVGKNNISINDLDINLSEDEKPFEENGNMMVPVRKIAEAVGYSVTWDDAEKRVTVQKENCVYTFTIGQEQISLGENMDYSIVPPVIRNDKAFIAANMLEIVKFKLTVE